MNLDVVLKILSFDGQKKGTEPFERTEISADPEEVHLPQSGAALGIVHAVPDALENGGERCDTNTSTNENSNFELEHIFGGRTEGAINVYAGKNLAESDFLAALTLLALLSTGFAFKVAAEGFAKGLGEVTDHTDVNGDVVLFRCAGESERMVLPDGNLGAAQENVLTSSGRGVLLLDLDLADVAGMLNDLGNVGFVSSTDLTSDTLGQVGESTPHPVLPEDTDTSAEGRKVRLDHAESSVNGPEDEEDDEEMMGIPEALKVGTTSILHGGDGNSHQSDKHDVSTPAGTSGKIGQDESHESQIVVGGEPSKVVPMSNCVNPREENNGPSNQLVESDILVKGNNVVQGSTPGHGDQIPANGEQDESNIDVESQSSRTSNGKRQTKLLSLFDTVVL